MRYQENAAVKDFWATKLHGIYVLSKTITFTTTDFSFSHRILVIYVNASYTMFFVELSQNFKSVSRNTKL